MRPTHGGCGDPGQDNRAVFDAVYSPGILDLKCASAWDRGLTQAKQGYVEKYGPGETVLDIGCGTGAFVRPLLGRASRIFAVDYSASMLHDFAQSLGGCACGNAHLLQADAGALPLRDACVGFVFSFAALYYVPDLAAAAREIARVMRPGAVAALEIGNRRSINFHLANWQSAKKGWPAVNALDLAQTRNLFATAGLEEIEIRSFQILPMYDAPRALFYLYPALSPLWKKPMGLRLGGRMLDEHISGAPLLRKFAFRHILLLKKP